MGLEFAEPLVAFGDLGLGHVEDEAVAAGFCGAGGYVQGTAVSSQGEPFVGFGEVLGEQFTAGIKLAELELGAMVALAGGVKEIREGFIEMARADGCSDGGAVYPTEQNVCELVLGIHHALRRGAPVPGDGVLEVASTAVGVSKFVLGLGITRLGGGFEVDQRRIRGLSN